MKLRNKKNKKTKRFRIMSLKNKNNKSEKDLMGRAKRKQNLQKASRIHLFKMKWRIKNKV